MTSPQFDLVVHATHEAGWKVGGIGAVLDGLLAQPSYNAAVRRSILIAPFNPANGSEMERLYAKRNGFRVLYSAHDGIYHVSPELTQAFTQIELGAHVRLLYGTRAFGAYTHEVLLVDARSVVPSAVNDFKHHLWERYGLSSARYEWVGEYDWYIRAAEPSFAALQALIDHHPTNQPTDQMTKRLSDQVTKRPSIIIAHEWLGLPLAFCALRHRPDAYRTVFYAHETATARLLVETNAGHDTRFYNAMFKARANGLYLENIFGDQHAYFKHPLILAAAQCHGVIAVGNLVVEELRFLSPLFEQRAMPLVYNGVPSEAITLSDRWLCKEKLQHYTQALFGFRPTWIFSHVTRLVPSKALWRDVRVMEQLDGQLAARGERAVLFMLSSTLPAGRRSDDVWRWEYEYGWPVGHRGDNGDLVGEEWSIYQSIEHFNRYARASRIVLVNQFGWSRDRCGSRMPHDMDFADLRRGTDVEFGQSIYEPFGIGQTEPLTYGALCCLTNVCGCIGFINKAGGLALPNIILADYVTLPPRFHGLSLYDVLRIGQADRDIVEAIESTNIAHKIVERLPRSKEAAQRLLEDGYALSQKMSWQVVVEEGLLPALEKLLCM
jgi:hypothetical protein